MSKAFKKPLCIIYQVIFFITLLLSLAASCIFRIGWPSNELVDYYYHIQNRLWFFVYIFLLSLTVLSLFLQLSSISKQLSQTQNFRFELFAVFIAFVMCLACFLGNQNRELFVLALLACLSWPIKEDKIIMVIYISQVTLLVVGFTLLGIGFTSNLTYIEHGLRHTLGFGHPNSVGLIVFSVIVLFWILYSYNRTPTRKIIIIYSLISLLLIFATYYLTKSRTSLLAALAFIVLTVIYFFFKGNDLFSSKKIKYVSLSFPILCAVLTFLFGFVFNSLNFRSNFSCRFYEGLIAIYEYGISPFGNTIKSYILDNTYYAILLRSGLVCYICYLILSSISSYMSYKKKKPYILIFMIIFHLYLMMENYVSLWPLLFLVFSTGFSNHSIRD